MILRTNHLQVIVWCENKLCVRLIYWSLNYIISYGYTFTSLRILMTLVSVSITWFTNHLKLVFWWINSFCVRCLCFHHNNILFVNCPVAKHFGICVKEIQRKIMIFCLISISINIYRFSLQPVSLTKSAKMITLVLKFHTLNA